MEFRENLKRLRKEHGMTQAQLAERLFVSRSAVAKWENGLGLPNDETKEAIGRLFGVSMQEIATKEPEAVIVEKNRRLHLFGQIVSWTLIFAITAIFAVLPFAIYEGKYGFTADMAAGVYANDDYIDTGDYRIYYFCFDGDLDDGSHWVMLQGYRPVKKNFWGFTVPYNRFTSHVVTKDNYVVGRLLTVKGKNGYYHLLKKTLIIRGSDDAPNEMKTPIELLTANAVVIDGVEYPLESGFFFITDEPVEYFRIDGHFYDVIE